MRDPELEAELVIGDQAHLVPLEDLERLARDLVEAGVAPRTRAAYALAWRRWRTWAASRGLPARPLDPELVALHLAELVQRGLSLSTIQLALAALNVAARTAGDVAPGDHQAVRAMLRGIRRRIGVAPRGARHALRLQELAALVAEIPPGVLGDRDRALLLLGFAGAMRRSELVALQLGDVIRVPEGLQVTIRRGKTDQEGAGHQLGIPLASRPDLCPVRAVERWRAQLGDSGGPLFRRVDRHGRILPGQLGDRAVALVLQRRAAQAGLDAGELAAHSLRHGFVTEAAARGVPERTIQRHTGHRSLRTLRGYIREGGIFLDNAAAQVL